MKYVELDMMLTIKDDECVNDVFDKFIEFVENNGWYAGGGMKEVDKDGNAVTAITKPDNK